jgi:hypothetical protein
MSKKKQLLKTNSEKHLKITATTIVKDLVERMPEHREMIEVINKNLPEIKRATSLFGKTQSQFMDNMMTVSHYTPLRNLRQILAQIKSTQQAVDENEIKIRKKEVELKIKNQELKSEQNQLKKELIQIEIEEIEQGIENSKLYLSGSIRTLANYTEQYNAIKKAHNIDEWTEEDFEAEEEEYHIKKAFEQGYCAALSHGGMIDEGNMIYFTQIGINGMSAQVEMSRYLAWEESVYKDNKEPTHESFQQFLDAMAAKYKGCSGKFANKKGMHIFSATASIREGDKSLFEKKKRAKHIETMKKLYAMTTSDNESESLNAQNKLDKMLKKYNMKVEDLEKLL